MRESLYIVRYGLSRHLQRKNLRRRKKGGFQQEHTDSLEGRAQVSETGTGRL